MSLIARLLIKFPVTRRRSIERGTRPVDESVTETEIAVTSSIITHQLLGNC